MRIGHKAVGLAVVCLVGLLSVGAHAEPSSWRWEWKNTDFAKTSINFDEIRSGGPPKDGIPSIDSPKFVAVAESKGLGDTEPVIGVIINGAANARVIGWYPLFHLMQGGTNPEPIVGFLPVLAGCFHEVPCAFAVHR